MYLMGEILLNVAKGLIMTIVKTKNGEELVIAPEGMLDTANAPAFDAEMEAAVAETTKLVLDFAKVQYISSSGLRVLLKAQKKVAASGEMKLVNVSAAVKEVFELTGFTNILTIV